MRSYNQRPDVKERIKQYNRSEKAKQRRREQRAALRIKVLNGLGNGSPSCACCGETNIKFLSIDHINGGGYKHVKEIGGHLDRWILTHNYPDGFRILCHNCNFIKGMYGHCPHRNLQEDKVIE